jgi:Stress responsive A/B Barrel Domain
METGTVRHILLARLRDGTTADLFQTVIAGLREMAGKIEGIVGFEYGTNTSPEGLNRGLTHVITLTFASAQARDAYLPHPDHRKFADWVGQLGLIEEVLVIDYIPQS